MTIVASLEDSEFLTADKFGSKATPSVGCSEVIVFSMSRPSCDDAVVELVDGRTAPSDVDRFEVVVDVPPWTILIW